ARALSCLGVAPSSLGDDDDLAPPGLGTQAPTRLVPVHLWHPEIQQDELGAKRLCHRQPVLSVERDPHVVAGRAQRQGQVSALSTESSTTKLRRRAPKGPMDNPESSIL